MRATIAVVKLPKLVLALIVLVVVASLVRQGEEQPQTDQSAAEPGEPSLDAFQFTVAHEETYDAPSKTQVERHIVAGRE